MLKRLYLAAWLVVTICCHQLSYAQTAAFSSNVTQGCTPLVVDFKDLSTGAGLNYFWDLGNGNTSINQNPSAIYYIPGTYTIKLIVSNGTGKDSVIKTNYVTVFASPSAGFFVDTTKGCTPISIKFTDTSKQGSGVINDWLWDFGDGTIGTQGTMSHTYSNAGSFTISLQVKDVNGCISTKLIPQMIKISSFTSVDFVAKDTHSCVSVLQANFTSTVIGGTSPYNYKWLFGDGDSATTVNPGHVYSAFGKYTVRFTVTDANNCQVTVVKNNYIELENIIADFTPSVRSGCSPLKVVFTNTTTPPNKYKYFWDFGNGKTSTGRDTTMEYDQDGPYDVSLKVTSAFCQDTVLKRNVIIVNPSPEIAFSTPDTIACKPPLAARYTASSTATIVKWEWDFGDTTTASIQNPTKNYTKERDYTTTLKATANNGCVTTLEKKDYIKIRPPKAIIDLDRPRGCKPFKISFTGDAESLFPIATWKWDFDDGKTSLNQNDTHTYKDTGIYIPMLIITDTKGCIDTATYEDVRVGLKPKAEFSGTPRIGCVKDFRATFTNLTTGIVQADSFYWEFGDGGTSEETSPTHLYDAPPGIYNVILYASHLGCTDTMEKKAYITLLPPYAKIEPVFKHKCDPDSVSFINKSIGGHLYQWTFSNGDTSTKKDVNKKFPSGPLVAILTVTDTVYKCSHSDTAKVEVPKSFNAAFTFNDQGCVPLPVKFVDKSSGASNYSWEFGNGAKSTSPSPIIIFDKPGVFSVKLTISNDSGCTKTIFLPDAISVFGSDVAAFVSPDSGCAPLTVTLKDMSSTTYPTLKTYWDMGNGDTFSISSGNTRTYVFNTPPKDQRNGYTIKLIVHDSSGCISNKAFKVFPVKPGTKYSFGMMPTCNTAKYIFAPDYTLAAGMAPFDYLWDFGDGPTSSATPVKEYPSDGDYPFTYQVKDAYGCIAKIQDTMRARQKPLTAGFSAAPLTAICPPLLVNFTDTSKKGHKPIMSREWFFGDLSTAYIPNPKKNYVLPGKYSVTLVVTDSMGCVDTVTMPELVLIDGPTGSFTFTPPSGCSPLEVNFKATTQGASRIQWDFGDGTLGDGDSFNYQYKRVGSYIPLLILSNNLGCTYALPPIDTIVVHGIPKALIDATVNCSGTISSFRSNSTAGEGTIVSRTWKINQEQQDTGAVFKHTFMAPGTYKLTLVVSNSLGCMDSLTMDVNVPGVNVELINSDFDGCLNKRSRFEADVVTDFDALADLYWYFGDGATQSGIQNPVFHQFANAGVYKPKVIATTTAGCKDTSSIFSILIGDTVPPLPPNFYRVTVEDNRSVRIDFGSSKDLDFKQYLLKRYDPDGAINTVFMSGNRNDTTFTNGGLNTLHNVYKYRLLTQNICNYVSDSTRTEMHGTVEVQAYVDTNQSVLRWNHYLGWDKIKYYVVLKEDPNQKGKWDSIGFVPGNVDSFIDTNVICYRAHYYRLKAVEEGGFEQMSFSDTTGVSPIHVPKVPSNEVVRITVENDREIWMEWLAPPVGRFKTKGYMIEKSLDGINFTQPWAPFAASAIRITDARVKVDDLNYFYRMRVMDSCGDLGPHSNTSKSILLHVQLDTGERPQLNWNAYEGWSAGVDHYDIERLESNGNFVVIGSTAADVNTYTDYVSEWNGRNSYCYRVTAYRAITPEYPDEVISHSNEDCAPVISRLHVPNAFTPNLDDINPTFAIKGIYIKTYNLKIYTRWGEFVYESKSLSDHWNGQYKGETAQQDVYVYLISALGVDNRKYNLKGNVTLLR